MLPVPDFNGAHGHDPRALALDWAGSLGISSTWRLGPWVALLGDLADIASFFIFRALCYTDRAQTQCRSS